MEFSQIQKRSRVKLQRSPQKLRLEIPPGEYWPFMSLVGMVVAMVMVVWLLITSLPTILAQPRIPVIAILGSGLIAGMLYWEFRPTVVEFDQSRFCIYKRVANRTIALSRGSTNQIQTVFHTVKQFGRGRMPYQQRVIVIQSHAKECSFGAGLSWDECEWLTNEIRDWLNLRSQH